MQAHYLQHVAFEGLGAIEPWLRATGYSISRTFLPESTAFPAPRAIDLLIVMGGPMGANDQAAFPWLTAEQNFIRQVVKARTPVLGVCLGAQLIAAASGARVYRNPVPEIGWFPIQGVSPTQPEAFRFPSTVDVFHWHGDTFDLPAGAMRLAGSQACQNQAFQLGRSVVGLQFHLETTAETLNQMVAAGRTELQPAPFVQSAAEILDAPPDRYRRLHQLLADLLTFLTSGSTRS